ncbi:MAG: hypothetical protein ACRCTE_03095 [Cellulosilyticaceae bacterium]
MNKKFARLVIMAMLMGVSSMCYGVFAKDNSISVSSEIACSESEAVLHTATVKGQTLIPLRAYLDLVGVKIINWQNINTLGAYAQLTVEAPARFTQQYESNLRRALGDSYGDTIDPLPPVLEGIVKQEEEQPASDMEKSLQEKALTIVINSQGNTMEYAFYDYANVGGTLYIDDNALELFGLEGIKTIDNNQAKIYFKTQEQIKTSCEPLNIELNERLKKLTPDEVIKVWIRAQQARSGALQYALMSPELQIKVLPEVKQRGWVTGGSSPTLRGGKVTIEQITHTDEQVVYKIHLESMLQGKVYEALEQVVTLSKVDNRWAISSAEGAIGYYTYETLN